MVTWEVGRRCNYDCTYCESTRHDLVSPHHGLDSFKKTFNFLKQWTSLYDSKRLKKTGTSINFTGGEPTVNPSFWKLVDYIKHDEQQFNLSLTTNGAWAKKNTANIVKNFGGVTVSYHAEADPRLKKQALDNILLLAETDIWLQVNVMLHVEHWDETVGVYNMLKEKGIRANPRPIGDGNLERTGWFIDADGTNRRTSHTYSEAQQEWFWDTMGTKKPASAVKTEGTALGRACCGGRCLTGKVDGVWQPVKLVNTEFKNWSCMVDWFFMHIDQHTGLVYHHQTCKALHGKKRGAIGSIDDADRMLEELKGRLNADVIEHIVCPNQRCGCGMCIPKARGPEDFDAIWKAIVLG